MTVDDRPYVLDDSGRATQIRRPAATERVRSLLATVPPGVAAQIERAAAPAIVRLDAMESVVEAAIALVATMARWQDQALTDEEIALRSKVRHYQEVSS